VISLSSGSECVAGLRSTLPGLLHAMKIEQLAIYTKELEALR
jgi:hypothetical protein